ncbi:MAG: response regulator transcription factor [Porphyromonadaceae bacterium]|nr:response regulator transcription factor [Porphyromonadaceae bacterium]
MSSNIKIAIAESCPIIRSGVEAQCKKLTKHKAQVIHLADDFGKEWTESPLPLIDILIINPLLGGLTPKNTLPPIRENCKYVALVSGAIQQTMLRNYDDILHITDTTQQISELFDRLIHTNEEFNTPSSGDSQILTPREREIIVCVVKGMTNKEIANTLYLSTHTVITHRRNITKKLKIHSPSGLTIYAIMNKLVELDEIHSKGATLGKPSK